MQAGESSDTLADPQLRIEPMDVTNGNPATKFTLMQKLPWYGTRDLRHEVADARSEEAEGRVAATWADLSTRIKQAYARYYYTIGSEQLTQQTLNLPNPPPVASLTWAAQIPSADMECPGLSLISSAPSGREPACRGRGGSLRPSSRSTRTSGR